MTDYNLMIKQLLGLSESSKNYIPLLSNVSALIYENMKGNSKYKDALNSIINGERR